MLTALTEDWSFVPKSDDSQLPITSAPEDPVIFSGLHWRLKKNRSIRRSKPDRTTERILGQPRPHIETGQTKESQENSSEFTGEKNESWVERA